MEEEYAMQAQRTLDLLECQRRGVSDEFLLAWRNGIKLEGHEQAGRFFLEDYSSVQFGADRAAEEIDRLTEEGKILRRNSTRESVLARTEGCLKRLNTDWLDLLLIHWPDHDTPFEETMGALEKLKSAGKIRHYGVSNFNVEMMEECERFGHLAANQISYHIYDRRVEAQVLSYCLENGIGFMSYGSLGYGLLTGAFTPETTFIESDWRSQGTYFGLPLFEREEFLKELSCTARLKEFAAGYGRTVAQLAIAWVLGHPALSVALTGVRNTSELHENVQATEWKLTAEDRAEIDRILEEEGVPTHGDTPQAV